MDLSLNKKMIPNKNIIKQEEKPKNDPHTEVFYLWSPQEKIDFFHAAKQKDIFNLMHKRPKLQKKQKFHIQIQKVKEDIEKDKEVYQKELEEDIRSRKNSQITGKPEALEMAQMAQENQNTTGKLSSEDKFPTSNNINNTSGNTLFKDQSMERRNTEMDSGIVSDLIIPILKTTSPPERNRVKINLIHHQDDELDKA